MDLYEGRNSECEVVLCHTSSPAGQPFVCFLHRKLRCDQRLDVARCPRGGHAEAMFGVHLGTVAAAQGVAWPNKALKYGFEKTSGGLAILTGPFNSQGCSRNSQKAPKD